MNRKEPKALGVNDIKKIRLSLFTILCNATGVYRGTVAKNKKAKFQEKAGSIIVELIDKIDNDKLTNRDVRDAIEKLGKESGVGASQKVINVYLKFYCIIKANKNPNIMEKLDCPIDRLVRKDNGLPNISIKGMTLDDYVKNQDILEEKYGIRIMADIHAYDEAKTRFYKP